MMTVNKQNMPVLVVSHNSLRGWGNNQDGQLAPQRNQRQILSPKAGDLVM